MAKFIKDAEKTEEHIDTISNGVSGLIKSIVKLVSSIDNVKEDYKKEKADE